MRYFRMVSQLDNITFVSIMQFRFDTDVLLSVNLKIISEI